MSDNNLSGKVSLDVTDYKAGVIELNRQIRVIESGFRASAASMGEWDKNASGLEMRTKALTSQIDLQKQKISALTSEYKKVVDEKGADSRAAQELEIKLNKQNETLGKMTVELNQTNKALDEMGKESKDAGGKVQDLGEKQDQTAKKTSNFKSALSGMGTVIKGVAVAAGALIIAVAGIGAALLKTVGPASDLSETVSKVGVVFGEAKGEVLAFGKNAASSLGMSENAALSAAGTYGNLFRALGITESKSADMSTSLITLAGDLASFNNMDPTAVLDSLRAGITGETEPLKKLGININEVILKEKARELGLYSGTGAFDASAKAQASYALIMEQSSLAQGDFARTSEGLANQQRILAATFEDIKASLGTAILPMVNEAVGAFAGYLVRVKKVVGDSFGRTGGAGAYIAAGLGNILKDAITDVSKKIPEMLEGGLGVLQGITNAITGSLPDLLPAVINMIQALVGFIVQNIPMLIDAGMQIILMLVTSLISMLPMLLTAAIEIIVQLANGLSAALPSLIPAVVGIIMQLVLTLVQNIPMLITAALKLIMALAQGLITALPVLIDMLPTIMIELVNGLLLSLPELLVAAVQIILTLALGIIENIPKLLAVLPQVIDALVKEFKSDSFKVKMKSMGEEIVHGISDGFTKAWENFKANFMANWNELVDKVKDVLGIHSPSTVFAEIGVNMAMGLGGGFSKQMANVTQQIQNAMAGITANSTMDANLNVNQNGSVSQQVVGPNGNTYQAFFETYNENQFNRYLRQTEMLYGS